MATMSAVQQTTGYGPAASAANSIPEFSGDVKSFADFEFKLKAVAFEFGLEEILLRPQEWLASQEALKHRIEGRSGASTRSSSSSAPVDHAQDQAQLNAEQGKYKHLARILIGKLKPSVAQLLRDSLPESEHFNPIAIYRFLRQQYAVSDEVRKVQDNPETLLLELLSKEWSGMPLLTYVRILQQKLSTIFLQAKYRDDRVKSAILGLIVKRVLDQVSSRTNSVFEPLLQAFMPRVLSRDPLAVDTLDEMLAEVERISLLHPVEHRRYDRDRRDKPKQNSGAASAAPDDGKGKPSSGGSHGGGSGKGGSGKHNRHRNGSGKSKPSVSAAVAADGGSVNDDGSPVDSHFDSVNAMAYSVSLPQPTISQKTTKMMLVDSGASHHCVREKSLFTMFKPGKHIVRIADNKVVPAIGKGTVSVNAESSQGKIVSINMTDVYLVPSFQHNIFSIEHFLAASDSNSVSLSSAERVLRTRDCDIPLLGEHKLIWLPVSRPKSTPASCSPSTPGADAVPAAAPATVPTGEAAAAVVLPAVQTTMTLKLFHERMGHVNAKDCAALAAQQGIRLTETVDFARLCNSKATQGSNA